MYHPRTRACVLLSLCLSSHAPSLVLLQQEHIGDLFMTTTMVPSAYGDQTYFIQHTRFDDDIKLRPEFLDVCSKLEDCAVCHVHGGKDTC